MPRHRPHRPPTDGTRHGRTTTVQAGLQPAPTTVRTERGVVRWVRSRSRIFGKLIRSLARAFRQGYRTCRAGPVGGPATFDSNQRSEK